MTCCPSCVDPQWRTILNPVAPPAPVCRWARGIDGERGD